MDNHFIYALEQTSGLGYKSIVSVLEKCQSFSTFESDMKEIMAIKNMTNSRYKSVLGYKYSEDFEKYRNVLEKLDITLINRSSDLFPKGLKDIPDAPYSLHLRGDMTLLNNPIAGIVGARKATKYGKRAAYEIAKVLSKEGYTIISGLAKGVDAKAHRGGLCHKASSIGVIGSGLDYIYPKENTKLYLKMYNEGLVISEFYLGEGPKSYNFPRRNRIITGLCDFLIVIEASMESGTMISVRHANNQGKDVLALPGSIYSKMSEGTNLLIRDGAYPLISVNDLYEYLENRRN